MLDKIYNNGYQSHFNDSEFKNDRLILDNLKRFEQAISGIVLAEAPGDLEYINRKPLFGPTGTNLREFIDTYNLWLTNTIKYRPVEKDNHNVDRSPPRNSEIAASNPYLIRELEYMQEQHKQKDILALGGSALKAIQYMVKHYEKEKWEVVILKNGEPYNEEHPFTYCKYGIENFMNDTISLFIKKEEKVFQWNIVFTYHTSGRNFNKQEKRELIEEGVLKFIKL